MRSKEEQKGEYRRSVECEGDVSYVVDIVKKSYTCPDGRFVVAVWKRLVKKSMGRFGVLSYSAL